MRNKIKLIEIDPGIYTTDYTPEFNFDRTIKEISNCLEGVRKKIFPDHGTKELKKLLKKVNKMSIEEYNELYERAKEVNK